MGSIEKVCEYSGEYGYRDMYDWKLNSIQIMPKYRKLFRGAKHTLFIERNFETYLVDNKYTYGTLIDEYELDSWNKPFKSVNEYVKCFKCGVFTKSETGGRNKYETFRFERHYQYLLDIQDEALRGKVRGLYLNSTYDLETTKRKLKRLLRCKKLNIVWVDSHSFNDHYDEMRETRKIIIKCAHCGVECDSDRMVVIGEQEGDVHLCYRCADEEGYC